MQISNNIWPTTSAKKFYTNICFSLDCISISELRSGIDSAVATVHENYTSQLQIETLKFGRMQHVKFIAWNKWKTWKYKQYEITATLLPHNILQLQLLGYWLIVFMNISQQQIHTFHLTTLIWNTKTLLYHITATSHYHHKTTCSYILSATSNNDNFTVLNKTYIIIKKEFTAAFY